MKHTAPWKSCGPRVFFLATNDAVAVSSLVPELTEGPNPILQDTALRFSELLATGAGDGLTGKKRRQASRQLWEMFNDPYDIKPTWAEGWL